MFADRKDAGIRLAKALEKYKGTGALVLAIPRGGVEVAYEVAKHLNAELSILVARKLPYPHNPEAGFGAIAEDGSSFIFDHAYRWLSKEDIKRIIDEQKQEIKRRIAVFRGGAPLPTIKDRTVILVDDGIAMGSTMQAGIMMCKNKGARHIIVAAPVAGPEVAGEMEELVDELIVLERPAFFQAVAQVYEHWYDVPDSEVIEIMKQYKRSRA